MSRRRDHARTSVYDYTLAVHALRSVLILLFLLCIFYSTATRLEPRRYLSRPQEYDHRYSNPSLIVDDDVDSAVKWPDSRVYGPVTYARYLFHQVEQRPIRRSEIASIISPGNKSEFSNFDTLEFLEGSERTFNLLSSLAHLLKRWTDGTSVSGPAQKTYKTIQDVTKSLKVWIPSEGCLILGSCKRKLIYVDSRPSHDAKNITRHGLSPIRSRNIPELDGYRRQCRGLMPDDAGYEKCKKKRAAIRRTIDIMLVLCVTGAAVSIALVIVHYCSKYRRLQERAKLMALHVKPMREVRSTYSTPPVVFSPSGSNQARTIKWHTLPHRAGRPIRDEEQGLEESDRHRYMACSIDGASEEGFFRRIFKKRGTPVTAIDHPPAYAPRIPSLQLPNPEFSVRLHPKTRRFSSGDVSLVGNRRPCHSVVGMTIPEEGDAIVLPNGGRLRPSIRSGDRRSTY